LFAGRKEVTKEESTVPGGTLDSTRFGLVGSAEIVRKVVLPPRR